MTLKNRVRRLIVLGAGASYAVGLPDGDRILPHLTLYANGPILPIRNRTPMDLFSNITPALLRYAVNTGFRKGDRCPQALAVTWRDRMYYSLIGRDIA
jgi:hypothetical protein